MVTLFAKREWIAYDNNTLMKGVPFNNGIGQERVEKQSRFTVDTIIFQRMIKTALKV